MRNQPRAALAAFGVAALLAVSGCAYVPSRDDFTNPPEWVDNSTNLPTLWYKNTTGEGYEYLFAYHEHGLDVCDGHSACTAADGRMVVLAPWWYWRGKGALRTHALAHEECHVNAIQSGQPDRCDG